jgi:hypothetical protein
MGPRIGLDYVEKREILSLPDSNSDPSVLQPVPSRCADCAISGLYLYRIECGGSATGLRIACLCPEVNSITSPGVH